MSVLGVVVRPLAARMACRVVYMVSLDIFVLPRFKRNMQQRMGLDRPYFKLTQIPMQFFRLFAKTVVRFGSFKMLEGAWISLMILFFFGFAMFVLESMIVLMTAIRDSLGIGSRWRVMLIFEPPMVRGLFRSMHSSISAAKRMSAFGLLVENASPIMFVFFSEK